MPSPIPEASAAPSMTVYPVRPASWGIRPFLFFSSAMLLTGLVSMLFADLLWRS